MRIVSPLALAIALAAVTPALAKDRAPAAPKLTPAVQGALADAQKAIAANDTATAQTKLAAAKAAATTDDDRYITGSLEYKLSQATKDQAMRADGVNMMAASGKASPELQQQLLTIQGKLAYQARNYPAAVSALTAAQQAGSTDPDLVPVLVSSYDAEGQPQQALAALNAAIDKASAAGRPVPAEWYQQGISIGYRAKGAPATLQPVYDATATLTKRWVAAYPTKSNWHDAMTIYTDQTKPPTDVRTDAFRMLRAAGALTGDTDYREYADNVYLRYPKEAMSVLDEGSSKGIVNLSAKNDSSEVMGIVKGKVAADQASLGTADKSARAAATGKAALNTADAYVGYGDYAKAIDLYKVAMQKGGIDVPTANLHMGWAQALSGDTAGAKQSFAAVTGPRKTIADFWTIHLDHPTAG